MASKQWDFEQKFPIFKLKFGFYRKIFRFSTFFKICKKWHIGALKCAKFQQNTARNFRSGNFSNFFHFKKIFFFAELQELEHSAEGTFFRKIGNFSTFSTNSKIPKIYLSGPISVQSFSKKYFLKKSGIQAVGFWAKISNFQTWNRISSENFPLFHFLRKFRNFIYLSLQVCKVSAKKKNLFHHSSFIIIIIIIHHHHD